MAASPRRVGAETSQTRDALLEAVAQMMLEEGYASVTYRALAAKAGVTPSLVQYYFPRWMTSSSPPFAATPSGTWNG